MNAGASDALLFEAAQDATCEITVVLPAKNEAERLARALTALACQRARAGGAFARYRYEILVLLNNTDDGSMAAVEYCRSNFPDLRLHVAERWYSPPLAHIGYVRRTLFEVACARFERGRGRGILATTDADTIVDETWLAGIVGGIAAGADAVTGAIDALASELDALSDQARERYLLDVQYRMSLARFEALTDPDAADPWPRHYHHTGASFAVTTAAYRRCGGMPLVTTGEDIALYDALRLHDAAIRHAPDVRVTTSARTSARAAGGMGERLAQWSRREQLPWTVEHVDVTCARIARRASARREWCASPKLIAFGQYWLEHERASGEGASALAFMTLPEALAALAAKLQGLEPASSSPVKMLAPTAMMVASGAG